MDLEFQDQLMVTSRAYYDMISRKTGALTGCSAELGAIAAGAEDEICAEFRDMGNQLGMAWQISEDIRELWGQRGDGMTPGNVLNKKKSLPLVFALENAPVAAKRELGNIYMKRVLQSEDVSRLISILNDVEARSFSEVKAHQLAQDAMAVLAKTGLPDERLIALRQLADWTLEGHTSG